MVVLFFFLNLPACQKENVTPQNALKSYLSKKEPVFAWKVADKFAENDLTIYNLELTSQKWRDIIWNHQLSILVPKEIKSQDALLFITGGRNKDGKPKYRDPHNDTFSMMKNISQKNNAIVAIIHQVPNQPLFGDKYEDEIISYTLHKYQNSKDCTWPLLFPMTKSAIKAMDAVQEFGKDHLNIEIQEFVVSGASKRGWTTWLTGANDPRVVAIAPMVIDVLNMPVQMDYQVKVWGDYSPEIIDYVNLGITENIKTPGGTELTSMIDPYSYRKNMTMPKMIFIGANDEYWPVDAVKHYINEIPGENYLHYVPNAGHDLNDGKQAGKALNAFFATTILNKKYPKCDYTLEKTDKSVTIHIKADISLENALIWTSHSQDRDFRDEMWDSQECAQKGEAIIQKTVDVPAQGFKAFYIDLNYPDPTGGLYSKSTRMFVMNKDGLL